MASTSGTDRMASTSGISLAVVGCRHCNDYGLLESLLDRLRQNYSVTTIVSGGCSGVDTLAREYANKRQIPLVECLPDWDRHGLSAGPKRNALIVERADMMLALVSPRSRGTWDSIEKAKAKGIKVIVIRTTS